MKKVLLIMTALLTALSLLSFTAYAQKVSVPLTDELLKASSDTGDRSFYSADGENSVSVELPDEYAVVTAEDTDRDKAYFNDLPIVKDDVGRNLASNGVVINAFSAKGLSEVRFCVFTDEFAQRVANLTPMEDSAQKSVIAELFRGLNGSGLTLLSEITVVSVGGLDFIKYYARYGGEKNGYCFMKALTVTGGVWYELTCYYNMPSPSQEAMTASAEILESVDITIKDVKLELTVNTSKMVFYIIILIAALGVFAYCGYSAIVQIRNRDKTERVRVRKR